MKKPVVRKFHTQKSEETKLYVDQDAEFKSKLHLVRFLSSSSWKFLKIRILL